MMKKINFYLILILLLVACQKEDGPSSKDLSTPGFSWTTSNVSNDVLEISISISSSDDLPPGNLAFSVDNNVIDNFAPTKGTIATSTSYAFNDFEEHTATITYSFNDGRVALRRAIKIQKSLNETIQTSSKEHWENY